MKNLENILNKSIINYSKLIEFGFYKQDDIYEYKEQIANGEFEVQIYISDEKKTSKVMDIENNMEYALVDIEDAVGEFIGHIRAEYEKVLNKFIKNCTNKEVFKSKQSKELIEYIRQKYGDELEFLWEKYDDNAIWRNKINGKWYATLFCVAGDKLGLQNNQIVEVTNIKYKKDCVDEIIDYKCFFPAYHMNKRSWITIKLDNNVDMKLVYKLVDNSYLMVTQKE